MISTAVLVGLLVLREAARVSGSAHLRPAVIDRIAWPVGLAALAVVGLRVVEFLTGA
jgi:hypothetical protein